MIVTSSRKASVAILTIDNPPVNALSQAVRAAIIAALKEAEDDPVVEAIILCGAGMRFSAGADIKEFGGPPLDPSLPSVCAAIERTEKPVIACLHGDVLGGALELALSCHYRVAAPGARVGLPEVKLGLLPGAGGTQRLPRLIGVAATLPIIVLGESVTTEQAAHIGLVDHILVEDAEADAILFALEVAGRRPLPRVSERMPDPAPDAIAAFKDKHGGKFKGQEAPAACLIAIEAAAGPFAEGLALERSLFLALKDDHQSQALRHAFMAERRSGKVDGLPAQTPLRPIGSVGIVGAGTMGGGIAMNFLSAGIPVTLVERDPDALSRGVDNIAKNYDGTVAKGRMTPEARDAAMGLLSPSVDLAQLAPCDLVIEAIFENMDAKKQLFAQLGSIVAADAIVATNTSYLDVDEIASAISHPERSVGLHFFSPAHVMRLLEVVRGARTSDAVLATAMALAGRIGKIPVVAGVAYGFIGNRILQARQREANKLILEGATPWQVDKVLVDFGLPMGPFQMTDLAGLDLGWHRDPARRGTLREILCAEGRWGQKKSAGFYDYDERRRGRPSPMVEKIIADFIADRGLETRRITDEEILERCLYPMVNEGARILEEGKAQRASDIDVVWLNGYGWPRWRGGPMFWSDATGLDRIVAALRRHADRLGPDFILSPLLQQLAAEGGSFASAA